MTTENTVLYSAEEIVTLFNKCEWDGDMFIWALKDPNRAKEMIHGDE